MCPYRNLTWQRLLIKGSAIFNDHNRTSTVSASRSRYIFRDIISHITAKCSLHSSDSLLYNLYNYNIYNNNFIIENHLVT